VRRNLINNNGDCAYANGYPALHGNLDERLQQQMANALWDGGNFIDECVGLELRMALSLNVKTSATWSEVIFVEAQRRTDYLTLKMKTLDSFETSGTTHRTQRHIAEELRLLVVQA
jgi:hypothetical protein